jgi:hypothetical protein
LYWDEFFYQVTGELGLDTLDLSSLKDCLYIQPDRSGEILAL